MQNILSYGIAGIGSPAHIAGEMIKRSTGSQMTHIPYKGIAPLVAAVLANEVPFALVVVAGSSQHIAAGKINAVAWTDKLRSDLIPNLPTFKEAGFDNVESFLFLQILAPAGTPTSAIQRLNSEMNDILASPEVKDRMRSLGINVIGGGSADASRLAQETYKLNKQIIRDLKISAE